MKRITKHRFIASYMRSRGSEVGGYIQAVGQYLIASCTNSVMRACEMGDVFVSV